MNIILLSGGSGKRLWPLSNDIRSKQFIKIFKKPKDDWRRSPNEEYADASAAPDANTTAGQKAAVSAEDAYESMLQRVYRQIKAADPEAERHWISCTIRLR